MRVADYMISNVTTLDEHTSLLDAVLLIRQSGKRHLPIVNADNQPIGIVTDRDVSRLAPSMLAPMNAEEYNHLFESTPITKAMTKPLVTIRAETPISQAVEILHNQKVGAIVVVNEANVLTGILTTTDMLGLLLQLLQEKETKAASGKSA